MNETDSIADLASKKVVLTAGASEEDIPFVILNGEPVSLEPLMAHPVRARGVLIADDFDSAKRFASSQRSADGNAVAFWKAPLFGKVGYATICLDFHQSEQAAWCDLNIKFKATWEQMSSLTIPTYKGKFLINDH